jgi:hypothetical protein
VRDEVAYIPPSSSNSGEARKGTKAHAASAFDAPGRKHCQVELVPTRTLHVDRFLPSRAPPAPPEWVRWLTDSELSEALALFDHENVEDISDLSEPAQLRCMATYFKATARQAGARTAGGELKGP